MQLNYQDLLALHLLRIAAAAHEPASILGLYDGILYSVQ